LKISTHKNQGKRKEYEEKKELLAPNYTSIDDMKKKTLDQSKKKNLLLGQPSKFIMNLKLKSENTFWV
jgi:hypothetical protein